MKQIWYVINDIGYAISEHATEELANEACNPLKDEHVSFQVIHTPKTDDFDEPGNLIKTTVHLNKDNIKELQAVVEDGTTTEWWVDSTRWDPISILFAPEEVNDEVN